MSEIKTVLDRFEGDRAVLLVGETEAPVSFPREFLPPAVEGDILTLTINVDKEATRAARQEASELLRRLLDNNG